MKKVICLALTFWLAQTSWGSASSFEGLSDLAGGGFYSYAWDVSGDGSTVVGRSYSTSGDQAFRWTTEDDMVGLGHLPDGYIDHSAAYGVSADGSVVVGVSSSAAPEINQPNIMHGTQAFRWTAAEGMVGLGTLPVDDYRLLYESEGWGVSADGSTVVGRSTMGDRNYPGIEAFSWTSGGGLVGLGDLPGGTEHSVAHDVSADGSTVVGYGHVDYEGWASGTEAFCWTSAGGLESLGVLPGWDFSNARSISADGSTVVGNLSSAGQSQAFLWTAADGMVGLGDAADYSSAYAVAVTDDGPVVVGQKKRGANYLAFIWDQTNGVRNLRDALSDEGVNLAGWTLIGARGISDDGTTIVGYGRNPSGNVEAFRATLSGSVHTVPEPSTFVLLSIGFAGLLTYAWRKRRRN